MQPCRKLTKLLKPPISRENHLEPFSPDEQKKILEAAYRLSTTPEKGKHGARPPHPLTGTFAKLLLRTGLRITESAMLHRDRLSEGRLFLYGTKNGKPVSVPLPPDLVAELAPIKTMYFFQLPGGSGRGETVSDYWRDQLKKVFAAASIKKGKPHRFRRSLVMNMLNNGSSVEDCAIVIGDSPAIVAQHYSEYVQSRQDPRGCPDPKELYPCSGEDRSGEVRRGMAYKDPACSPQGNLLAPIMPD